MRGLSGLIVGVDAGATAAFAVVDLDGNFVDVGSGRGWGAAELALRVSKYSPKVVACDTNPPNALSKKLAALFGAKLFFPKRSLSVLEKLFATRDFGCKNAHERDALAAALKAFHLVQNKLKQAHRHFSQRGVPPGSEMDALKAKVLSGRRMHDLAGGLAEGK